MSDDVWPGLATGPNEHETRDELELVDAESLQTELNEQSRIGNGRHDPFSINRVPVERRPK